MPFANSGGLRHYYRLDGNDDQPVLMLSHSLGCDHTMWDVQAAEALRHFRVLRYDTRGHGASDCPSGDYSIELLARDALGIADALGLARFAFGGLSLGGMIGQWLAAHQPHRLAALVLANTSPRFPDPSLMESRRRAVLENGMTAIVDAVMGRFFSPELRASRAPQVAAVRRIVLATNPAGYAGCCAAVRDMDQVGDLPGIRTPTLIIVGDGDVSTPWAGHGEVLAREIPHAQVARIPAAHLSNLEQPRAFTDALLSFLAPAPAPR